MAVQYVRTEETTAVVRYEARLPLDASTDVHMLLTHARRELNGQTDPDHPNPDRDPGYGDLWIEHLGDTGEDSSRIAVCFRKVSVEEVEAPDPPEPSTMIDSILVDVVRARLAGGARLADRYPDTDLGNAQKAAYRAALSDFQDEIDRA